MTKGAEPVVVWYQWTTHCVLPCAWDFPERCCNWVVLCQCFYICSASSTSLYPISSAGPWGLQPVLSSWGFWNTTTKKDNDRKSRVITWNHLFTSGPLHMGTELSWTACGKAHCAHVRKIIHNRETATIIASYWWNLYHTFPLLLFFPPQFW